MKTTIRHGAVLRCDMVTVSTDGTEHSDECEEKFISYSMSSVIREQAKAAKWERPTVGRVRWPGQPPMENAKKVDLCPEHGKLVITVEEAKEIRKKQVEERKAARAAERAEAKAEKKRQKAAARDVAKAVKEKNKRRKRGEAAHAQA